VSTIYRNLGPALRKAGARLVYETARRGHWIVELGEQIWPLYLLEYEPGIWRICARPYHLGRYDLRAEVLARISCGERQFEISFVPDELDQVAGWIMASLAGVSSLPDWAAEPYRRWIELGKPLRGSVWTERGTKTADAYQVLVAARHKARLRARAPEGREA